MTWIHEQRWFLASLVLGLAAIVAENYAGFHASRATLEAARVSVRIVRPNPEVVRFHRQRAMLGKVAGLVIAGLAGICGVASLRRREPGPRVVFLILLAAYLLLFFVMV